MADKAKRGGRRRGAGRRPGPGGAKIPKTVWLTAAEVGHCERVGGGTAQDGLRRLVRESMGH